jgi:hypothetical protein
MQAFPLMLSSKQRDRGSIESLLQMLSWYFLDCVHACVHDTHPLETFKLVTIRLDVVYRPMAPHEAFDIEQNERFCRHVNIPAIHTTHAPHATATHSKLTLHQAEFNLAPNRYTLHITRPHNLSLSRDSHDSTSSYFSQFVHKPE